MTPSICRFFALFFVVFTLHNLTAQRTGLTLTGGAVPTAYRFAPRTVYPNTSFSFSWEGGYTRPNVMFGADLYRTLNAHWQLESGLRLLLTGYTQTKDYQWPSEFAPDGTYTASLPDERLAINHLFLEIPLVARYLFSTARVTPYAEAGMSANYYLTTGVKERLEGETKKFRDRNEEVRPLHIALDLAAGVQWSYSARQAVFAQAIVQYLLNGIEKAAENPGLGYGFQAGWRLRLKA